MITSPQIFSSQQRIMSALSFGFVDIDENGWLDVSNASSGSLFPKIKNAWNYSGENWEIVFEVIITGSGLTYNTVYASDPGAGGDKDTPALQYEPALHNFKAYYSTDGSNWTHNTQGTTELSLNTPYFVKLAWDGTVLTLLISTDGINWNTEGTTSVSTAMPTKHTKIQIGKYGSAIFECGKINILNSYIKIGDDVVWGNV